MVNFSPYFVANFGEADVKIVVDHIEDIAGIPGKKQCVLQFSVDSGRATRLTLCGSASVLALIMME